MKESHKTMEGNGLFKGVFMAYSILLLHMVLLAGLGCLILFFRGFLQYMLWIFLGGSALVTYSGYRVYKRMRDERKNLGELLSLPMFTGRSVEVNFLGGLASVKVGNRDNGELTPYAYDPSHQLEDPVTTRIRELKELARLFENELITLEEYNRTKEQLLNGTTGTLT
ncbi:MAG: SHOCT domain-containing protein [Thermodesulfobacteriota bacterium]